MSTTHEIVYTELPPALTQKQATLFMGVSQGAVSEFMRKHPRCVQHDGAGRKRILKQWAEAYTLGTVDSFYRAEKIFGIGGGK